MSVGGWTAQGEGGGARELQRTDTSYPARLLDLPDSPAVLYARGMLPTALPPAVAIVGTRAASSYGLRVARSIASALARAGVAVVSGLARGIDGASHEAALSAGGRTVAVLGTGLDRFYPRSHRELQTRIGVEGLLLSELPGSSPGHRGSFPRRNRIIAALADVVVVVEAGEKSGALITADYALELNRTVACVPNGIEVPSAVGSNALLKRGAEPILHPDDVLSLLDMRAVPTPSPVLDGDAAACWDALQRGAIDVADIARSSGLSQRAVMGAVSALEIEGLVVVDMLGSVRATTTAPRATARG
jgi:DNA processing protein